MKALNEFEIENLLNQYSPLLQLSLQKVQLTASELWLGFWNPSEGLLFWVFYFGLPIPFMRLKKNAIPPSEKATKPLLLFLRSHALGLDLAEFSRLTELGRVVRLQLKSSLDDKEIEIEFSMIPGFLNLSAELKDSQSKKNKKVFLKKPKPYPASKGSSSGSPILFENTSRSLSELNEQWEQYIATKNNRSAANKTRKEQDPLKLLARIDRSIAAVKKDIEEKRNHPYRQLAQAIEQNALQDQPESIKSLYNAQLSKVQNIEWAYQKAKAIEAKLHRTEERLKQLEIEKKALDFGGGSSLQKLAEHRNRKLDQSAQWKGRTLDLDSDTFIRFGKSAEDNLKLLRQARPWYLWVHLKDYPSSHGICFRHKSRELSPDEFRKIGQYLVDLSVKESRNRLGFWELLVAEVRFVRPIKKQKGRVTVNQAKTYRFSYD